VLEGAGIDKPSRTYDPGEGSFGGFIFLDLLSFERRSESMLPVLEVKSRFVTRRTYETSTAFLGDWTSARDFSAALFRDGDDRRAHRHVILEVRPPR
jgi:hypothetical protein